MRQLVCFLFLIYSATAFGFSQEVNYWGQEQIDAFEPNTETTELVLKRQSRPDNKVPLHIDYSNLVAFQNLEALTLANELVLIQFTSESFATLPIIPTLKKLKLVRAFGSSSSKQDLLNLFDRINANQSLEELDLSNNPLNLKNFNNLHALQNLKKLNLSNTLPGWLLAPVDLYAGLHQLESLKELDLQQNHIKSEMVPDFFKIPNLEKLSFSVIWGMSIKFTELPINESINELSINLGYPAIDPSGLHITLPNLKKLHFNNLPLSPESNWAFLFESNTLEELSLTNVTVQFFDFEALAKSRLKFLELNNMQIPNDWRSLSGSQLESLSLIGMVLDKATLEQLNSITLSNLKTFRGDKVRGLDLRNLCPHVSELFLAHSDITGGDVKKIGELEHVEILDISHTSNTGSALSHIKKMSQLKSLSLAGINLEKGDFSMLASMPHLEMLDLSNTYITLSQINQLATLVQLKTLDLRNPANPNITANEVDRLRKNLPATTILF